MKTAPHPFTVFPLGFPWATRDPFLFCVHHLDLYPSGNEKLGPTASLKGRNIGQDFAGIDGWRMYHGQIVPGFPQHPHRGFETVTITRRGFVDHSDSLGATARYGEGDVQWLTAGKGIQHCEMFPLLKPTEGNPVELFQIWLNLPARNKFVTPHFSMFWNNQVPKVTHRDAAGKGTEVLVVAGALAETTGLAPPPDSWASQPGSEVAIWTLRMEPRAQFVIPAALDLSVKRSLYFFAGDSLTIDGVALTKHCGVEFGTPGLATIVNGPAPSELLMLQGRPINEAVAQYGPFVMNTDEEIRAAFRDYQQTQFGGWPWPNHEPVHPRDAGRFAKYPDGKVERAPG